MAVFRSGLVLLGSSRPILLIVASSVFMALPVLFQDYEFLGWSGLVPLLIVVRNCSAMRAWCCGFAFGFGYVGLSAYWVVDFLNNFSGIRGVGACAISILYWGYGALPYAFGIGLYRYCIEAKPNSELAVLPIALVACSSLFPHLFEPHFTLGQIENLWAIQAIEIFGVYGADFIIVMTNALVFRLIFTPNRFLSHSTNWIGFAIVLIWLMYGLLQLDKWRDTYHANGVSFRIGVVQPNDGLTPEENIPKSPYSWSYPREMEHSLGLVERGAELVVWPEAKFRGYFDKPMVALAFHQQTKIKNFDLLFHDTEVVSEGLQQREFSSAVLVSRYGESYSSQKTKLIPIAEYLPDYLDTGWIRSWLIQTFGNFISYQSPGQRAQMTLPSGIEILPLICFEALFSNEALALNWRPKGRGLIVVMSNDVWFGRTRAPYQHTAYAVLRAIENRTPLIHVVNNGPSVLIEPSGEKVWQGEAFKEGGYLVDVNLASVSVNSQAADLSGIFRFSSCVAMVLLLAAAFLRAKRIVLS